MRLAGNMLSNARAAVRLSIATIGLIALMTSLTGTLARAEERIAAPPLVKGAVDDSERVTLAGNVHPLARPQNDLGRVEDSFPAERLHLLLKRSNLQEQALKQFLQDAHTPGTESYHQWLTPEQFGQRFGAADSDVAAVTAWLQSHGFTVNKVQPGRIAIEFSGTAGQLREAFQTEIHSYKVVTKKGEVETHYANSRDPQIPAAFAGLIAGISPMNSFHGKPLVEVAGKTKYDQKTHQARAQWTYPVDDQGDVILELGPGDFAMQYDMASVYKSGITGSGESIGILSASNVDLSVVSAYRKLFGLSTTNLPTIVVDGNDPGLNGAAIEAYLDVEESGAVAPAAKVVMYVSAGTVLSDPILTSGLRALQDNVVSVISASYGTCEADLGAAGNAAYSSLWQEAAAQGITGFVSAGDGGSAGCDDFDTEGFAQYGLGVNGYSSTPYNVSVGGTDMYFSDGFNGVNGLSSYWNENGSAAPTVSLLKPAPEQVWNNFFGYNLTSNLSPNPQDSGYTIVAGSGGVSSSALYSGTTATGYPKPSWQSGTGVPAENFRYLPDVSLYAANGPNYIYYPICAQPGDCLNVESGGGGAVYITSVGGTSASSPAMAGIQALVDQATKSRQGQANYVYYALANKTATADAFHDITVGGNEVLCDNGTPDCILYSSGQADGWDAESGYPAGTGYDEASGLGSVDVAKLIANWKSVTFKASKTTLALSSHAVAHGIPITATATVAPASGSGTPTGNVGLDSNQLEVASNGLDVMALKSGKASKSIDNLPGGTYQVTAEYSGDGTYAASTSAPVTVTITPEKDTLKATGWVVNPFSGIYELTPGIEIPYGSQVYLDAQPVGVNEAKSTLGENAPATGAVTFTDKVGTTTKQTGAANLNSQGVAEWAPTTLAVGSHTLGAAYAGDDSYAASSAPTAATVTVFKGNPQLWVIPYEYSVKAGSNVTVNVQMNSDELPLVGSAPTGTIAVTLGSQTQAVSLKPWSQIQNGVSGVLVGVATFTKVPAGVLPLSATYAGDANWEGTSFTCCSVTSLSTLPPVAVTLTATTTSYTPSEVVHMTGTVTVPAGQKAPNGGTEYLYFEWGNLETSYYYYYYTLQKGSTANTSYVDLSFPANELKAGTNYFVATFKGDTSFSAQSSQPLIITLNGGDFSLTTTKPKVEVLPGASVAGSITLTPIQAYSGAIAITCVGPTGITCTPTTAKPTLSTAAITDAITFKAASNVKAGVYPTVVTATGGGLIHTAQILVAVH